MAKLSVSKTLLLARQHGLVETLTTEAPNLILCDFSHLIVIDFEATCWANAKLGSEIIEFPAICIDMATGNVVAEFHHFVSPTENPKLSDFCKNLTGITQEQVDNAMPLKVCLTKFTQWLTNLQNNFKVQSFELATWSDWDFGVCLLQECRRKGIMKPDVFNKWIDLRALYSEHSQRPQRGLKAAVQDMGLQFEGREHSGLVDARNTAKLAWKMNCEGVRLRVTKTL